MENIWLAVIGIIPTIACAWFVYNQSTHDKKAEAALALADQKRKDKAKTVNKNIALIYGELWTMLSELKLTRVFILQPHPRNKHAFISISFEVRKKGIDSSKDVITNLPIAEVPLFTKTLATTDVLVINDLKDIEDLRARSLFRLLGTEQALIYKLQDVDEDWIGSLVLESSDINQDVTTSLIKDVVETMQYLIPDFE